ncbi:MAG: acylphosphatase [Planctomycetota bacterium]|nr:acylphosphatase [Planctomycetota bacterium]
MTHAPDHSGHVRQRVVYSGRVQGVGFRATVRGLASDFPVTGFVQNLPDGSVLIEAQGAMPALEAFRALIRERLARNIRSESDETIVRVEFESGFEIRK